MLGVRLGWVAADEKEEPALAAVMERLRHEGDGILLIYDNANNPRCRLSTLSAARRGGANHCYVERAKLERRRRTWSKSRFGRTKIGADYLDRAELDVATSVMAALALSEALGGLPLAHEQAAAYCDRPRYFARTSTVTQFEAAPAKLLDTEKDAPADIS